MPLIYLMVWPMLDWFGLRFEFGSCANGNRVFLISAANFFLECSVRFGLVAVACFERLIYCLWHWCWNDVVKIYWITRSIMLSSVLCDRLIWLDTKWAFSSWTQRVITVHVADVGLIFPCVYVCAWIVCSFTKILSK